ncbi:MAG: T9SS type A sorting domain-containing protein [Flavobacteriales bacterium]|nr:T9SS type A sorting domain-containing protein [Flavobacteriales bacterium]
MVRHYARTAFAAALLLSGPAAHSQCPNDNTYWQTTTPTCPGSTVASTCLFGGEYQLINVVAGNTYTFSTCGTTLWDTQITLYNNAGGGSLGFNDDACGLQSSITWVATFTGQLRVLIDAFPCINLSSCATLTVNCSTPVVPPPGGCIYMLNMFDSFGDGWGASSVGVSINGGPFQYYTVTGTNNSVALPVMPGNSIVLTYNNAGPWQGENSYSLTLGGGAVFTSGTPPVAGVVYAGSVTCVPPPAPPEDCVGSITICNGQSFNNTTNNTGQVADLNLTSAGCLSALERQGTWYNFTPSASGQIGFTINPANPADDYDFAIYGPFPPGSTPGTICPPLSAPLRCSFAAPSGATGLNFTATDLTEGAAGDKWVRYLDVTVGQVYLLYISNFSQSGLAFSLGWDLQGGASLDCNVLNASLVGPEAQSASNQVLVGWTTLEEHGTATFGVERAEAGDDSFVAIGSVNAVGGPGLTKRYEFLDPNPRVGLNRYRLKVQDSGGAWEYSRTVDVMHGQLIAEPVISPNPTQDLATIRFEGKAEGALLIELFDGTGRTRMQVRANVNLGWNALDLPLAGLAEGHYLVRIQPEGGAPEHLRLAIAR